MISNVLITLADTHNSFIKPTNYSSERQFTYNNEDKTNFDVLNKINDCFEKDYDPLIKIKRHLIQLSNKYELGSVIFKVANKNDSNDIDSFIIEVPNNLSYEQVSVIWDEIIEDTVQYAKNEEILSSLDYVTIILK